MAHWTTPRTWVTGEKIIASLLNTHLRDNMDFLHDHDRTHAVLTQNNGLPKDEWGCLHFGGEGFDRGGMHSSRKREAQVRFRQDGLYYLIFKIAFDAIDNYQLTSVNATIADDKFTQNSHGLEAGDQVKVTSLGGLTGITASHDYFVVRNTFDTFKLSDTDGGDPKNLTGANATVTVTREAGGRFVMLRKNANQNSSGGHNLGEWNTDGLDGYNSYVSGSVLARFSKGDHVNLFARQDSGQRGLRALSGSDSQAFLQAVQMGG